jgi:hypothetical protein
MLNKFGSWTLPNLAKFLNSKPSPLRDELRGLFARYRESGPNLQRMMAADKKLERTLRDLWEVRCVFTDSGFVDLELFHRPFHIDEYDTRRRAIQIFGCLILNHQWAKLDGPCERCERYFVRERRSFRTKGYVCCSKECLAAAHATASMKAKRDDEYYAKLEKCRAVAESFSPDCGMSFRDYVSQKTGFTRWWVRRAMNETNDERKLREPSRKGKKAKS